MLNNKIFLISDFDDTRMLKNDEYGVYVRLLEYAWQNAGRAPISDKNMVYYLRVSPKKWQYYKKTLQNFFEFSDELLIHQGAQKIYEQTLRKSKQNTANRLARLAKLECNLETAKSECAKDDLAQQVEKLLTKLQKLFSKYNMTFPEDRKLIIGWLESGASIDQIYKTIEDIMYRIHKKQLPPPKSFVYFMKEIKKLGMIR